MSHALCGLLLAVGCDGTSDSMTGSHDAGGVIPDGTSDAGHDPLVVSTSGGRVQGISRDGVRVFYGVPYAAPPLADARFRAPAPVVPWEGVRDASAPAPSCLQVLEGDIVGSEDCLTLDVYAPEGPGARPVWVWIHGGGNRVGASSEPLYDAARTAARADAVIVNIQYRLGPLGFFSHPEVVAEDPNRSSGNFGILDQQAALRWVQENAAAFGGDNTRVMIIGQSAGAQDAWILVASPASRGLFSRAAMHSGSGFARPVADAHRFGTGLAEALGCSATSPVLACLRALDAHAILRAEPGDSGLGAVTTWIPVIDGYVLTDTVFNMLARGEHNHVPILSGTTSEETAFDYAAFRDVDTVAELEQTIHRFYDRALGSAAVEDALSRYPVAAPQGGREVREAFIRLTTDQRFSCPTRFALRAASRSQEPPVFRYQFTMQPRFPGLTEIGAFHLWDIAFLFQTWSSFRSITTPPSSEEQRVADLMIAQWAAFASSGDPSVASVAWPRYGDDDAYVRIDDPLAVERGVDNEACDFWDRAEARIAP